MSQITTLSQCAAWALSGGKERSAFRIGTEYERVCVGPDGAALQYDGDVSIRALLDGMVDRGGWQPKQEAGRTIALLRDGASITLEPAGQFELSGAPLRNVAEMTAEMNAHIAELDAVATPLGIRFAYVGINPLDTPQTAPKMPKGRYDHMRRWMPRVGTLGLDMMHLTCTVQANIDFLDEADAMRCLRLGYLTTPVLIALFANSPWHRGTDTGMASFRAHIWTDVDPQRCDPGGWVFEADATVADYVRWAAGVPMYFLEVPRADGSLELLTLPAGFSFADFIAQGFAGHVATLEYWETHVGTLFPDVRLKKHIEIRAADCVAPRLLPALPGIVEGLFYDPQASTEAFDLLRDGDSSVDRMQLRAQACASGLSGAASGLQLRSLAVELVGIAKRGLGRLIAAGYEEESARDCLDELESIARGDDPPLHTVAAKHLSRSASLTSLTV
jgi:glutamate--cysteine ligase